MKIKWVDIKTKVSSNFTATAWREKWNLNILTNMHSPPARCKFCDQQGKALKLTIAQDFVTDTWGTWTNLTAWWTIPLADRPGIRQRSYFSVLRTLMFSLCVCLLWFKIITLTLQIDTGEKPNTRYERDASTPYHQTTKTSPIHQQIKKDLT